MDIVLRVVTEDHSRERLVVTECANCGLVWAPRFHGPWPGSPCSRCRRPVTEWEHWDWPRLLRDGQMKGGAKCK